ncbi:MAG TPA: hypothetical protein PKD90_09715 [Phnomibacter sp.]|nr:hypothetical protein [Phnomibacter sp.]
MKTRNSYRKTIVPIAWCVAISAGLPLAAQPPSCHLNQPALLADSARQPRLYVQLAEASKAVAAKPGDADALIWLGRRQAYVGAYTQAIETFTQGQRLHPQDARFLRHRGHRFITLRCFDKAIADFEAAASLIQGKPDVVEPDGMPNVHNIPVSTLHTNIYYHLGLAYYLKGDMYLAAPAWQQCLRRCTNKDMYVATANWLHLCLLRLGRKKEAAALLKKVNPNWPLLENAVYMEILKLYKNKTATAITKEDAALQAVDGAANDTFLYGYAMYLKTNGKLSVADSLLQTLKASGQWGSFGRIAAETEENRPWEK